MTVCHSRTHDLPAVCRRADILVAAVGAPEMVKGDWVKPGATVIDVGINRTDDGLVGDVEFKAASEVARRDPAHAQGGVGAVADAICCSTRFVQHRLGSGGGVLDYAPT